MSGATRPRECDRFAPSIEAYADGELDPSHAADMEAHVLACEPCAERLAFARAIRSSVKRSCDRRVSDALRVRVCAALSEERYRERIQAEREADRNEPRLIRFRYVAALAAAAGVVFSLGVTRHSGTDGRLDMPTSVSSSGTMELDSLLDELVALHAHPLPPETTDPDALPRFDPLVGVPVRRPQFKPFGGSFDGARVHAIYDRRAALLQYTMQGGHRVTVYVFDPRVMPVHVTRLQPRTVHDQSVYVGTLRGYSVAAAEESGIGYALASDLDDDQSTELVLAAGRRNALH
jgi:anti-sigma factor (TIGR02949 family)